MRLYSTSGVKNSFRQYIPDEEALEAFCVWAFGQEYKSLGNPIKFMEAWNSLHEYDLLLSPDSHISEDCPRMVNLWKASLA